MQWRKPTALSQTAVITLSKNKNFVPLPLACTIRHNGKWNIMKLHHRLKEQLSYMMLISSSAIKKKTRHLAINRRHDQIVPPPGLVLSLFPRMKCIPIGSHDAGIKCIDNPVC